MKTVSSPGKARILQITSRTVSSKVFSVETILLLLILLGAAPVFGSPTPAAQTRSGTLSNSHTLVDSTAEGSGTFLTFVDVTQSASLDATVYPFGNPIWGDFNGDGNLDLLQDNHFNKSAFLYRNNGDGTFTDIRPICGLKLRGDRHGAAWGDFDNDGDLDLFTTHGARKGSTVGDKKDELDQNQGGDLFTVISEQAGATNPMGRARSAAWGDYNNDGFIDLLIGNLVTDLVLYQNNGDGTFVDVTAQAGLAHLQYINCAFADFDNDGLPDIFCTDASAAGSPDALFKNKGDSTFENVSSAAGIAALTNGRTIAWGDYDNDGNLDLFISRGIESTPLKQTLYRNNGNGTFTDVTDQAGLGTLSNNRAAAWGDYNNDGYIDLYVVNSGTDTNGKGPNYLFRNNKNRTFTNVARMVGVDVMVASRGRGAAWGDYDNDGFLDLFVTNGEDNTAFVQGPQFLFRNKGNKQHWLKIKLVGNPSNRQGLGAKVTIQAESLTLFREMNGADMHYLSQGAGPLHFGLGQATVANNITIKWPSGLNQTLSDVAADQEVTVEEVTN